MSDTKKSQQFGALTAEEVADLLGVTLRMVSIYVKEKGLPTIVNGRGKRFAWPEVREWYVQYRLTLLQKDGTDGKRLPQTQPKENIDQAMLRNVIAEADLKELKLARERGQVVALADIERKIADLSNALKTKLLGWPTKMIGRIHGIKEKERLFKVLTTSARELCGELVTLELQSPGVEE